MESPTHLFMTKGSSFSPKHRYLATANVFRTEVSTGPGSSPQAHQSCRRRSLTIAAIRVDPMAPDSAHLVDLNVQLSITVRLEANRNACIHNQRTASPLLECHLVALWWLAGVKFLLAWTFIECAEMNLALRHSPSLSPL